MAFIVDGRIVLDLDNEHDKRVIDVLLDVAARNKAKNQSNPAAQERRKAL